MSENAEDQYIVVREYNKMDIFWKLSKPEIVFSNNTNRVRFCFKNKYLINALKNIIMRALLITDELAKNADPKMLTSHVELNDFHPKKTDAYDITLTIKPDWDKTLYDIVIMNNGFDESNKDNKQINSIYKNINLTQNDLLAILHNLLPKASRHVLKKKSTEENYLVSVSYVK